MKFFNWLNDRTGNMKALDVACLKIAVMAFTLLAVKFFPTLLNWPWYAYAILFVVFAAKPVFIFFKRKKA